MKRAQFRFYAGLNDFLPTRYRSVPFSHAFELSASVKDMAEGIGVPHPEIALILVNGEPVEFSYQVEDGDQISLYPAWRSLGGIEVNRLANEYPGDGRFVLDVHLGRLARYLRMLGFDTVYHSELCDADLARIASSEARTLLTRDLGLLKRAVVTRGYYVRETEPRHQLREILQRFDLSGAVQPFRRCLRCNSLLRAVAKESVNERIEQRTARHYEEFWACPECGRIYWKGSHYQHMTRFMQRVLSPADY